MEHEIQVISDGDGLTVLGEPGAVDRFLAGEGLLDSSRTLDLNPLRRHLSTGAAATQAASTIAANSGRWVKLTQESAANVSKWGLRESVQGLSTGVLKGDKGQIKGFVEFARATPTSMVTNPAVLAGAAGMMAQLAMQQQMNEITDYLAVIDEKVDDVLRAQKDAALARMIGVGLVIDEAMTIREARGRVDEITWSKVQGSPATIAETQAYALRQLDALAEKLDAKASKGDFGSTAAEVQSKTKEWLIVLARTFQLQEGIAVLELDRVLDATPNELDGHRRGLRAAREDRLSLISQRTYQLIERMGAAADRANGRVLLNPIDSREVVVASNRVGADIAEFHQRLGIEHEHDALEARRWSTAAVDAKDLAVGRGTEGMMAAKRLTGKGLGRAKSAGSQVGNRLSDRLRSQREGQASDDE